jgi:hypothetical protein
MFTREVGLLPNDFAENPYGVVGVLVGWLLSLCVALGVRWLLRRSRLGGAEYVAEWLMWTTLFGSFLCTGSIVASVVSNRAAIEQASRFPIWHTITTALITPFFTIVFLGFQMLYTIDLWTYALPSWLRTNDQRFPSETAFVVSRLFVSFTVGAVISTAITIGPHFRAWGRWMSMVRASLDPAEGGRRR